MKLENIKPGDYIVYKEKIDLYKSAANKIILDGLNYISVYSVEEFKQLSNCQKIFIKVVPYSRQLFFTHGCNIGFVAGKDIPKEPVVAIVANSNGKIFPLSLIPATTALGTIKEGGREMGILYGANVVMPNLSPMNVRKKYLLYNDKIATGSESAEGVESLRKNINDIGYILTGERGDYELNRYKS